MLSISFRESGRQPMGVPSSGLQRLSFVGILEPESQPMACSRLRCQPVWPVRMAVSALSVKGLDDRGWPEALPRNQLAQGHCTLQESRFSCEATGSDGTTWSAEAHHRGR